MRWLVNSSSASRRRADQCAPRLLQLLESRLFLPPKLAARSSSMDHLRRHGIGGAVPPVFPGNYVPVFRSSSRRTICSLVGGSDNSEVRPHLEREKSVRTHYYPQVEAKLASGLLAENRVRVDGLFSSTDSANAAFLKSTAFAAYCAHGVIPVLPHPGSVMPYAAMRCQAHSLSPRRNRIFQRNRIALPTPGCFTDGMSGTQPPTMWLRLSKQRFASARENPNLVACLCPEHREA